jgi:predicted aldo/keto reductase-like oxidoreductase
MPHLPEKPLEVIDRYRKELKVDYIDCLLMHCMTEENWDETHKRIMNAFEEAKQKKIILSHGVSCHSLGALATSAKLNWVDVNLVRINPQAVCIDTNSGQWLAESKKEDLPFITKQIRLMRQNQHGVIGMKLIGNGEFTDAEDREKSIRYVMQSGLVDAATIGFKSSAEIDEAIMRINRALAEIA